ncbi:MAG TPA: hypothetical protein VJH03_12910, partial [Blastocatellia bacterium]|nr:hypothetical protein [Blastocatellia bacterium]
MRLSKLLPPPAIIVPVSRFLRRLLRSAFRKRLGRRLVCFALIVNLLMWPGSHLSIEPIPALASTAASVTTDSVRYVSLLFNWLFGSSRTVQRTPRETFAGRAAHVSRLIPSPRKFVGYQGQRVSFNAMGVDFAGRTIQGVKFSWASSDTSKVQIDESGQAMLVGNGLAWITCSAGFASIRIPVLVRPGARRLQTDDEWRLDQDTLGEDGSVAGNSLSTDQQGTIALLGGISGGEGELAPAAPASSATRVARALGSLIDKFSPTAYAQSSGGDFQDFLYDELWSQPRNLVGSPRNRAVDSSRIG